MAQLWTGKRIVEESVHVYIELWDQRLTANMTAASKTISILLLGTAAMEEHDVDMVSIATSLRDGAL
jgi:hypothetical protein